MYVPRVVSVWIPVAVASGALLSCLVTLAIGRVIARLSRSPAGVDLAAEYHLID